MTRARDPFESRQPPVRDVVGDLMAADQAELTLPPADQPPPDVERLAAIAAQHDIEILGPPGTLPAGEQP